MGWGAKTRCWPLFANLCRIAKRVQQRVFAPHPMIAPVERLALAPAAATDDHQPRFRLLGVRGLDSAGFGLCHDIRSVSDELAIDTKNGLERAFNLRWSIVLRLQTTDGRVDQFAEDGNIFGNSEAEVKVRFHHP